jgi:hypothetical protein
MERVRRSERSDDGHGDFIEVALPPGGAGSMVPPTSLSAKLVGFSLAKALLLLQKLFVPSARLRYRILSTSIGKRIAAQRAYPYEETLFLDRQLDRSLS